MKAKPKIYLETTIASYLTARPSRDLVRAAHQKITKEWWEIRRKEFELYVSQLVIREAREGDVEAARRRLEIVQDLSVLNLSKEAKGFSKKLIKGVPIPAKASVDALHIAVAVVHDMDYLLTWNCVHIANATLRKGIEAVCRSKGYKAPVICTPEELLLEA